MKRSNLFAVLIAALVAALGGMQPAAAADWSVYKDYSFNKLKLAHPQPFAKQHALLQVSEANPHLWTLALNNAANLINYFGQDKVQVVVVSYGPGLKMLLHNSRDAKRIASLSAEGVEFDACHNTMEHMKRKIGHLPKLVASAVVVPAGVVRIMQLEQHGYDYIKP
ncbi:MAG: DsrE family protein [Gammaproteobacteria bacterium]|jgi:uncharacterized protein